MIEALSFLGHHGQVARDANSSIYCDSKHAAGVCLGTIQARTHVLLALACQQSMLKLQYTLRFIMQLVYGHTGNLENECADHAAALGTLDLVSSQNSSTRSALHILIPMLVLVLATTLGTSLTNCVTLELTQHRYLTTGVTVVFFIGFSMTFTHALHHMLFALSPFSRAHPLP